MRLLRVLGSSLACLLLFVPLESDGRGNIQSEQAREALEILRRMSEAPGMAAAIARNGEVLWHHEAGLADIEGAVEVSPETVFRLASVSKAVTAVVTAKALQDGHLELKDTASEWLEIDHDASLEQLLSHTGSVDHYNPIIPVDLDRPYPSSVSALPTVRPHLMNATPGRQYVYSTFGYTLAAAMVETASGATYPQLLASLAEVAETPSLRAPVEESAVSSLTRFYQVGTRGVNPARPRNFSYAFAGAGVVSNAVDLARFLSLFASGQLVEAKWRDTMLQPARFDDGTIVQDQRYEVALGWRRQSGPLGQTWFHHAGVTDGARTVAAIEPASGVAVVILSNASWTGDLFGTAATLANLYLQPLQAIQPATPRRVLFEGEDHELGTMRCLSVTCIYSGPGTGGLPDWLSGGGRKGRFEIRTTPTARYVASPYGLALFNGDTAHIGSRSITLQTH
ncbi:MAG: serine hydrolase domain-containing protein [Xanthomonadales bacterium]|nr:serine hydrolase domain-containing protein [Xanthomonadales bacterium]